MMGVVSAFSVNQLWVFVGGFRLQARSILAFSCRFSAHTMHEMPGNGSRDEPPANEVSVQHITNIVTYHHGPPDRRLRTKRRRRSLASPLRGIELTSAPGLVMCCVARFRPQLPLKHTYDQPPPRLAPLQGECG